MNTPQSTCFMSLAFYPGPPTKERFEGEEIASNSEHTFLLMSGDHYLQLCQNFDTVVHILAIVQDYQMPIT